MSPFERRPCLSFIQLSGRTYLRYSIWARCARGHNLIELSCVLVLLLVVSLLGMDVGVIVMGSSTNERTCRDAARAAAQGSDYATALRLAQAAVVAHPVDGYYLSQPAINATNFVYQDFGGNPPPNTSPFVSVTTSLRVRVPAPVLFAGAEFNPSNGLMTFNKTYTFPIVKTQLYLP